MANLRSVSQAEHEHEYQHEQEHQQEREQLRTTFDGVADSYQDARPAYPPELFDEVAHTAGLRPDSSLLEIGCGPGTATIVFAERGYAITCVEMGSRLAAQARRNLAGYDAVTVTEGAFETWRPADDAERFDLAYAATSWHWLDPAVRCARVWHWLKPGGHVAIWGAVHVLAFDGDPFFIEIQQVYDEINEGIPAGTPTPRPGALPDSAAELESSGLFTVTAVRQFDWEITYDAEGYIRLLDTFSGHISMQQWQRDRLYGEIRRRLAARPDGLLRRHWGAALTVGRRLDAERAGGAWRRLD